MSKSFHYINEEFRTKTKLDIQIIVSKMLMVLFGNFIDHVDHPRSHSGIVGTSFLRNFLKFVGTHDYYKHII